MGAQMLAIVAEGKSGRIYLPPLPEHIAVADSAVPDWRPDQAMANDPRNIWCIPYGLETFADLFTRRQLVALTTFSDLVGEARERARQDALAAGLPDDGIPLAEGSMGATAYGDAIATYLGLGVSKLADATSSLVRWKPTMDQAIATFARQALPMVWDYAESSVFNKAAGDYTTTIGSMVRVINTLGNLAAGDVRQIDATDTSQARQSSLISTDPPWGPLLNKGATHWGASLSFQSP